MYLSKKIVFIFVFIPLILFSESKLKDFVIGNGFTKEDLYVIKNKNDLNELIEKNFEKELFIKFFNDNKFCKIKKDTYVTLLRGVPNVYSFSISEFGKWEKGCSGFSTENYIENSFRDLEKYEKDNQNKYWEKYYNSLSVDEMSRDLSDIFNKKTPLKLDTNTTLISTNSNNDTINVKKEVIISKDILYKLKEFINLTIEEDKKVICNDFVGKIFFKKNGIINYDWDIIINNNKIESFSHKITKKECNLL